MAGSRLRTQPSGTVTSLLNKARDLTIQASNGSLSQTAREAIALELESIKESLLDVDRNQVLWPQRLRGNSDSGVCHRTTWLHDITTFCGAPDANG